MKHTNVAHLGQAQSFIREGNIKFTPAQANAVLNSHAYAKNRDITRSSRHVAVLAEIMRRGLWLPKDQIAFASLNGDLVLVNGHHRMAAQIQSGRDIEWSVAIYPCGSDDDVSALYSRFDTNMKKRSDENIISALGLAAGASISPTMARSLWRAVPLLANNLKPGRRDVSDDFFVRHIADDRLEIARAYAPEAREYEQALSKAASPVKRKLLSGSITAVGLVTLKAHLSTAYQFWEGIAKNDGLRRGDPRATLIMWLMEGSSSRGAPSASIFAACKAWNYFVEGKPLQHLKVTGNPIHVAGTIFTVSP